MFKKCNKFLNISNVSFIVTWQSSVRFMIDFYACICFADLSDIIWTLLIPQNCIVYGLPLNSKQPYVREMLFRHNNIFNQLLVNEIR